MFLLMNNDLFSGCKVRCFYHVMQYPKWGFLRNVLIFSAIRFPSWCLIRGL